MNKLPDLADLPGGGVLLDLGGGLKAPGGGLLFLVVRCGFFFFDTLREEGEWQGKIMLL